MPYSTSARVMVACAALALLSACGSEKAAAPQVASLPGSSAATAPGSPTSAPVDQAKRPQLRLDSSDEERDTLWGLYNVCLKEHGHKMLTGRGDAHAGAAGPDGEVGPDSPDMNDDSTASKKAEAECAEKLPLQPPEMSADTNPHYADDYRDYVSCLNAHDVAVHATDPLGSGWTYNDGVTQKLDETQQRKVDHDCLLAEFTGH